LLSLEHCEQKSSFLSTVFYLCRMLIDTHTHLYLEQFDEDRDQVIQQALQAGLGKFFLPNIDMSSVPGMLALTEQYPGVCYAMMGLHPCSVEAGFEADLQKIYDALANKPIIAIGEIGVDLFWDKSTLPLQREAFRIQVQWAKEMKLPIVIHARDSYNELFEELNVLNDDQLSGVFHCFTGSLQQAEKILSYGNFYLGIGGVSTFKNSGLNNVLPHVPLNRIILETDSPYLAPVPHRGKRNESAYTALVAQHLSQLLNKPFAEIEQQTTQNALNLFQVTR
jgi:TatD DNase family protein